MSLQRDREGDSPPLPARATGALPGTPEKVAVLARRLERGESLWHPDDAVLTDDCEVPARAPADD